MDNYSGLQSRPEIDSSLQFEDVGGGLKLQDVNKGSVQIRYRMDVVSAGTNFAKIHKAITAGFFFHVAQKDPQEGYQRIVENQPVYIHPSSALFQRQPDWVIYHELVMTTKDYMREVVVVDPKWFTRIGSKIFMRGIMNPIPA